jgi:hypothetical protein
MPPAWQLARSVPKERERLFRPYPSTNFAMQSWGHQQQKEVDFFGKKVDFLGIEEWIFSTGRRSRYLNQLNITRS